MTMTTTVTTIFELYFAISAIATVAVLTWGLARARVRGQ
jgi:hypothetical protein